MKNKSKIIFIGFIITLVILLGIQIASFNIYENKIQNEEITFYLPKDVKKMIQMQKLS